MAYQVFVSHTKKDKKFCDDFDRVCARIPGIGAFRSEFESIELPDWKTIRDAMRESCAMFLLIGHELVASQASPDEQERENWKYTQNWIAYEIGLASQLEIDVWVLCDGDVDINFPVPYFNNYALYGISSQHNFNFMRRILEVYAKGGAFPAASPGRVTCGACKMKYNLWGKLRSGERFRCPHCLRNLVF